MNIYYRMHKLSTQSEHIVITHHTGIHDFYDWALLQRIQMKQFSHLICSYSLFILLRETETLCFSSQRDPGTPSILLSTGNAMWCSGMNHQVGSAEQLKLTYCNYTNKKAYRCNFLNTSLQGTHWFSPLLLVKRFWCCEEKLPCGDIVWVAGRTGKLPQIITSETNLMCGIQSVVIGTAAALEWSSKCYLLIHGMRTDMQSQRIDCAISSLCAVLTQCKREMRFNIVMRWLYVALVIFIRYSKCM